MCARLGLTFWMLKFVDVFAAAPPSSVVVPSPDDNNTMDAVSLSILFVAWYGFNAGYNVYHAYMKVFPHPIAIAVLQLVVGLFYALPLWMLGVRKAPKITFADLARLLPIALLNGIGHASAVYAMCQKGGGSFTHVIKASEPVVSVLLGLIINGTVPKPLTALTLLPISYGVAYASTLGNLSVASMAKELTTVTALMAMVSNVAFAMRSILKVSSKVRPLKRVFNYVAHLFVFFCFSTFTPAWLAQRLCSADEPGRSQRALYDDVADVSAHRPVCAVGGRDGDVEQRVQRVAEQKRVFVGHGDLRHVLVLVQ